jgi:hypothetical protein
VARARADISGLDLALDRLDAKHATASVSVSGSGRGGILGKLSGLFGGGGGAGGGGSALSGGLFGSPVGIGAIAGGGLIGLGSIPGLVGLGLGGGVGLGAIAGGTFGASEGTKILKADTANITHITTALKSAVGKQKDQLSAALKDANKQYAKDSNFYAPFLGFQKSLKDLMQVVLKPLQPIMKPLIGIVQEFGKGLTALGPQMTAMFKASLPFLQQFMSVMLQSGKILIPAFTQAMTTMVKSGALKEMTQGLVYLVQGLAGFIKALGPGMKASGQIFERVMLVVKGLMIGIGKTVSFIANLLETNWGGAVKRMWHDTVTSFDAMRHDIASIFDQVRHDIASAWNAALNWVENRVGQDVGRVTGWFRKLPGMVLGALTGLGHSLYSFAHSAMGELWSGFKSVAGSIISWIKGFGSSIINGLKGLFGIHSPSSVFHGIGENLMHGLLNGLKAGHGKVGSFLSNVAGTLTGGIGLGGVAGSSGYAALKSAAAKAGWTGAQWQALYNVEMREAGFNIHAQNPVSSAYGMAQFINGPSEYYQYGGNPNTAAGQAVGMVNYIRQRYGNPGAAWAHEVNFGWYDRGGMLEPGLTLAYNGTGRPEPVGAAAGTVININVNVPPTVNPAQAGRQIADLLKAHTKSGGTLYPAGVKPR